MISRIGYRRLLPILLTLVHAALLYIAARQHHSTLSSVHSESAYHAAAYQGESSVAWEPREPKPPTPAQKLATLINLPALILGIPIALALFHGNDMASLYAALPFVPLVWYCVGRWLDGLLGYIGHSHVLRRWRGPLATLLVVILSISICAVTPVNHHRTADTYWVGTALVVWSGLFLAMCLSGFVVAPSVDRSPRRD
jgi:hypothetical protein